MVRANVARAVAEAPRRSEVPWRLHGQGAIDIVGGMCDVATGAAEFM